MRRSGFRRRRPQHLAFHRLDYHKMCATLTGRFYGCWYPFESIRAH